MKTLIKKRCWKRFIFIVFFGCTRTHTLARNKFINSLNNLIRLLTWCNKSRMLNYKENQCGNMQSAKRIPDESKVEATRLLMVALLHLLIVQCASVWAGVLFIFGGFLVIFSFLHVWFFVVFLHSSPLLLMPPLVAGANIGYHVSAKLKKTNTGGRGSTDPFDCDWLC